MVHFECACTCFWYASSGRASPQPDFYVHIVRTYVCVVKKENNTQDEYGFALFLLDFPQIRVDVVRDAGRPVYGFYDRSRDPVRGVVLCIRNFETRNGQATEWNSTQHYYQNIFNHFEHCMLCLFGARAHQ